MIYGVQSFGYHLSLCLPKPSFWLFKVLCLYVWQLSGMLRKEKLLCWRDVDISIAVATEKVHSCVGFSYYFNS